MRRDAVMEAKVASVGKSAALSTCLPLDDDRSFGRRSSTGSSGCRVGLRPTTQRRRTPRHRRRRVVSGEARSYRFSDSQRPGIAARAGRSPGDTGDRRGAVPGDGAPDAAASGRRCRWADCRVPGGVRSVAWRRAVGDVGARDLDGGSPVGSVDDGGCSHRCSATTPTTPSPVLHGLQLIETDVDDRRHGGNGRGA